MTLFLALLLAHTLSDFAFQPSRWTVAQRSATKTYVVHAGVVAVTTALTVGVAQAIQPSLSFAPLILTVLALGIGALHGTQDFLEEQLLPHSQSHMAALRRFLLDQLVHIALLGVAATALVPGARLTAPVVEIMSSCLGPTTVDRWLLGLVLAITGTLGTAVAIRKFLEPFAQHIKEDGRGGTSSREDPSEPAATAEMSTKSTLFADTPFSIPARDPDGLEVAGYWIGLLERTLLILAVAAGGDTMTSAGLLVAFKSIYRFKSLDDRPRAEYYILGTLASFTVAILSGVAIRTLLTGICVG